MRDRDEMLAAAVDLVYRCGLSVIPVGVDSKIPAIKWKHLQDRKPTFSEIASWPECNVGIVTGSVSGIVVVDCESEEDALWVHQQHAGSEVVTKTKRGYHFYFSHPGGIVPNGQKLFGRYDVRGDGGYVLAPPSVHSLGEYEWRKTWGFDRARLTPFKMEWRPETRQTDAEQRDIRDGVAYISTIRAVSGQRGHDATYQAACSLRAAGMSEGEALLAMQDWNQTNADPPWSNRELLHKIQDAYR